MTIRYWLWCGVMLMTVCLMVSPAFAQTAVVAGVIHDDAGGALPGVSVELHSPA